MIKVEKNFSSVPNILKSENRKEAFENNIHSSAYVDKDNRYKVGSVQKKLNEIYHLKCAFCEQKLLDSPKHIEHYRPKDTYYWLAYSWDNLLLACGSCNSSKGDRFKTINSRVVYNNEQFDDIHGFGNSYDDIEKPLIVNPEKDDVLKHIKYDNEGIVFSENVRVKHTIDKACKLNRDELVGKRLPILNDFVSQMNKHYKLFGQYGDYTRFEPDVEIFLEKMNEESEFYSFRYFILNNVEIFFENENMQKILKKLIQKVSNAS